MLELLLRRLIQTLLVLGVISLIAFVIQEQLGDPLRELSGQSVSTEERTRLRHELGLDRPFALRYGQFVGRALRGDLGHSYFFKEPALPLILARLPATLELVLGATLIVLLISVPVGLFAAIRPRHPLSQLAMGLTLFGISVPVFIAAILGIMLFSVKLGWLPAQGRGELSAPFGWKSGLFTLDGVQHLLLPACTLASLLLPLFVRLIRAEMTAVLNQEYIKFAWAKGLAPGRIWWLHAFKNTLLPLITVGGMQIGGLVAYAILTETIFQWPGMGALFLQSVNRADGPVVTAYLLVVGVIFVITSTLVDLLYGLVDPRIELSGTAP